MIIKKGDENMKFDLFTKLSLIIIVVLLALNIILPILSSSAPSYAAKNIQYEVIYCDKNDRYEIGKFLNKEGNEYGKEGWELINDPWLSGVFIFKR